MSIAELLALAEGKVNGNSDFGDSAKMVAKAGTVFISIGNSPTPFAKAAF
ncbi:MAG: hypothetical protein WC384_16170 [Prolixibacteraceae bacterium]|jgi:hypothetical protein